MFNTIRVLSTAGLLIVFPLGLFADDLAPMSVEGATWIDSARAKQLFDEGVLFVDPRRDAAYESGRIPGALHLDLKKAFTAEALAEEASVDDRVVFYCNGPKCKRSARAASKAVSWGYKQVYYYRDGLPAWQNAGYPVE